MEVDKLVRQILEKNYDDIVDIYASILYQLCNPNFDPTDNIDIEWAIITTQNSPLVMNEVLHRLHQIFPELRKDAITLISSYFGYNTEITLRNYWVEWDAEVKPIPEVEEILKSFQDDIVYHYGKTFYNDHFAREQGFTEENVVIYIKTADPTTVDYIYSLFQEKFGVKNVTRW